MIWKKKRDNSENSGYTMAKIMVLFCSILLLACTQALIVFSSASFCSSVFYDADSYSARKISDALKNAGASTGILQIPNGDDGLSFFDIESAWKNTDSSSKKYYQAYQISLFNGESNPFPFVYTGKGFNIGFNSIAPLSYLGQTIFSDLKTVSGEELEPFDSPNEIYISERAAESLDFDIVATPSISLTTNSGETKTFVVKGIIDEKSAAKIGLSDFIFYQYMNNRGLVSGNQLCLYVNSGQESWLYFVLKTYGKSIENKDESIAVSYILDKKVKALDVSGAFVSADANGNLKAELAGSAAISFTCLIVLLFCNYASILFYKIVNNFMKKKTSLAICRSTCLAAGLLAIMLIKTVVPFLTLLTDLYLGSFASISVVGISTILLCFLLPILAFNKRVPSSLVAKCDPIFRRGVKV